MKQPRYVLTAADGILRTREIAQEEADAAQHQKLAERNSDFVQFSRSFMPHFVDLIRRSPAGGQVLIFMSANMDRRNEVCIPVATLCAGCNVSRATMHRALLLLKQENWIEASRVGATSTYKINARVFWSTYNTVKQSDGIFSAHIKTVVPQDGGTSATEFKTRIVATVIPKKRKGPAAKLRSEK